jgi:hypothetical protein
MVEGGRVKLLRQNLLLSISACKMVLAVDFNPPRRGEGTDPPSCFSVIQAVHIASDVLNCVLHQ